MQAPILAGKKLCFVSILRAGNGILDGMLDLVPSARVGHVGLYRDTETLVPVEYYPKLPEDVGQRQVIGVEPLMATEHSAGAAGTRPTETGAPQIKLVRLPRVSAGPRGV